MYPGQCSCEDPEDHFHRATRKKGEKIGDYYIRISKITETLIKLRSQHTSYLTEPTALKIMLSFPPAFALKLITEEKKDYTVILQKVYEYVDKHPESKLTDADIEKKSG